MTTKQRLETLTASLEAILDPRMGSVAVAELVEFSCPTLRKIAKSNVEMDRATRSLVLIKAGKGTKTPLIWLGLVAVPTSGRQWMADAKTARFTIDAQDYLAELQSAIDAA
jgi:hypothetical protein